MFAPMKGQPKRHKYVAKRSRKMLGENIRQKMEVRFKHEGDKYTALADACGVSRSTVQRLIAGEVGATIDTITQFANSLHCEPHELLLPPKKSPADR